MSVAMKVEGSVIMVVGAGRGIGRAAAELFADAGGDLLLAGRTETELAELAFTIERKNSVRTLAVTTDVTNSAAVVKMVDEAVAYFGRIDTLVYAAGIGSLKAFGETSEEEFQRLVDVNVGGASAF